MSRKLEQVIREGVDKPEAEPADKQMKQSQMTFGWFHPWFPVTCWSNVISGTRAVLAMASCKCQKDLFTVEVPTLTL